MFVFSVRASALRFFGIVTVAVIAVAVLAVCIPTYVPTALLVTEESKATSVESVSYEHMTNDEARVQFLAQYGWIVETTPTEAVEVTVPAKFDTVYQSYNDIQKEQGLNLARYRGKKVMRYTYTVSNYEDYDGTVYANLLLYKNRIIGGDICSASADGFLHGFEKE